MPTPVEQPIRRRIPRGQGRAALLDATLTLVRRQGWSATTVDEVCAAAGVTKGAFFHHFASKDALGVAAAARWTEVTSPIFAAASYHRRPDPLARILGYLDLRAAMANRAIEEFTCFAGTTVQETFATSTALRDACHDSIAAHVATLTDDFRAAIALHRPRRKVTAESLALYTQTVIQGGFVLSKAEGSSAPLLEALDHFKRYLTLLFTRKESP